ncbi:MAG: YceI family protein [Bacteroidota bacterium]
MKRTLLMTMALILSSIITSQAQTKYKADIAGSKINWVGKKVTGEHTGTINLASGEFTINNGMIEKGKFEVDMTSIKDVDQTDEAYRTKLETHLKSDDFFGVVAYPKATFVIDKPVKIENGITLVDGKITIKGVTQPIVIKAVFSEGKDGMRIYATITIDRTKFNVKYGSGSFFENLGDKTIYDEFYLTVSVLAQKQ